MRPSWSNVAVALVGALFGAVFGRNGVSSYGSVIAWSAVIFGAGSYVAVLIESGVESTWAKLGVKIIVGGIAGYVLSLVTPAAMFDAVTLVWAVLFIEAFVIEKVIFQNVVGDAVVGILSGSAPHDTTDVPEKDQDTRR